MSLTSAPCSLDGRGPAQHATMTSEFSPRGGGTLIPFSVDLSVRGTASSLSFIITNTVGELAVTSFWGRVVYLLRCCLNMLSLWHMLVIHMYTEHWSHPVWQTIACIQFDRQKKIKRPVHVNISILHSMYSGYSVPYICEKTADLQ